MTVAEIKPVLRLFVSQPMAGRPDAEVFDERHEAMRRVQAARPDCYVVLIPSFLSETVAAVHPPVWYLGASLQLMAGADLVCMAPGWSDARGCQIEHLAARKYGLDVVYLDVLEGTEESVSEGE